MVVMKLVDRRYIILLVHTPVPSVVHVSHLHPTMLVAEFSMLVAEFHAWPAPAAQRASQTSTFVRPSIWHATSATCLSLSCLHVSPPLSGTLRALPPSPTVPPPPARRAGPQREPQPPAPHGQARQRTVHPQRRSRRGGTVKQSMVPGTLLVSAIRRFVPTTLPAIRVYE